jgi:triacylglycerol lipase
VQGRPGVAAQSHSARFDEQALKSVKARRRRADPSTVAGSVLRTSLRRVVASAVLVAVPIPFAASAWSALIWGVPNAVMDAAVTCPAGPPTAPHVLLVHGTGLDSRSWSTGLEPLLAREGYVACTINLPLRGTGDIQVASEYVGKIDVVTHSQGGLEVRWALRFFPQDQGHVGVVVELGAPNHGTEAVPFLCDPSRTCQPALMQMLPGSRFLEKLDAGDQTPGGAAYVSIWSETDPIISPVGTAASLPGATNLSVQSVCPFRPVSHVQLLTDPVVEALVSSALQRHGAPTLAAARQDCGDAPGATAVPKQGGPVAPPGPEPALAGYAVAGGTAPVAFDQ